MGERNFTNQNEREEEASSMTDEIMDKAKVVKILHQSRSPAAPIARHLHMYGPPTPKK